MWKVKRVRNLAVGVLIGATGFGGQFAIAEDMSCTGEDIGVIKTFVDKADITLAEAILTAESQSKGKAIHATLGCEQKPGEEGLKTDNYQVCCLAKGRIVEVCVDSQSGEVLATHESSALPASFRLTSMSESASKTSVKQSFRIQKASDLIGKPVQNAYGEQLGEVQDLAIDAERGRVVYGVLSFGGFLGLGDKWFAIPIGALILPDHAKFFVLQVEKDRLTKAPGFAKDSWPILGDDTWGTGIHEFYGHRPFWLDEGSGSLPANLRIQKASEIIGRSVQNDRGDKLGEIKDLVIDPDRNRVAYAVLTFGGFMGLGDKLFAIPSGVLQLPGTGGYAVLTVDKDRLKEATGFDQSQWPNLADPTLAAGVYEFYGLRPYWMEDLRGGRYLTSEAGKTCHQCSRVTAAHGFAREGSTYCCAGCANGTGCTCGLRTDRTHP